MNDMATTQILFAGFGGQGIRQVSWLPSYGPEMRGGTANCSDILSDEPIGSPIVSAPDILIAMNLPSYDKYEGSVNTDGYAFIDSSLIHREAVRKDIKTVYVPATQIAADNGLEGLANMVMVGKVIKETKIIPFENIDRALEKVISARHQNLAEANRKALALGYNL